MARGNHSGRGRGDKRGAPRGSGRDQGRGRGFSASRGRGRGRGGYDPINDADFTIYDWADSGFRGGGPSGFNSPRGRGRGNDSPGGPSTSRGGFTTPHRGFTTPRGGFRTPRRGFDSPRGGRGGHGGGRGGGGKPAYKSFDTVDFDLGASRGRGSPSSRRGFPAARGKLGNWQSRMNAGVPLSKLLNEDRPLLRPVVFVRSVYTATLFEQEEEILKPLVENVAEDEASHVPTADRVTRVFGGDVDVEGEDVEDEDSEEQLEEIDFSEIGRIQAEVDAAAASGTKLSSTVEVTTVEQQFTGFYIDTTPAQVEPAPPTERPQGTVLGEEEEEDEVIVYVAPNPRAGPITPPAANEAAVPSILESTIQEVGAVPQAGGASTTIIANITSSSAGAHSITSAAEELSSTPPNTAEDAALVTVDASNVSEAPLEDEPDVQPALSEAKQPGPPEGGDVSASSVPSKDDNAPIEEKHLPQETTQTAAPQPVNISSLTDVTFTALETTVARRKVTRRAHPARTPKSLTKKYRPRRKGLLRSFGSFGASLAEAQLQEEATDHRKAQRRRGDSDLEWGDESDEGGDIEELSTGVGAMDIDSDIDTNTMSSFVKSMGAEGFRTVTMDDIADAERMRQEDEEDQHVSSEDEGDGDHKDAEGRFEDAGEADIVAEEEEMLVAGVDRATSSDDSEDEDEDTEDDEETPRRSFQARLQRIRENAKGKRRADAAPESSEEEDKDGFDMNLNLSWSDKGEDDDGEDESEDDVDRIQVLMDLDDGALTRKDRKLRSKLFRSIHNGDFDFDKYEELISPAPREKDKGKHLPPDLKEQWEKDRQRKAENKRKRAMDRMALAADPLAQKKGGKKGRKAMLLAARMDASIEIPNRIVDLVSLETQIRRFLVDIGGRDNMVLPPCNKHMRKKVHELANAFNLKSQSKGKGDGRYTTLIRTSKSGVGINERKVRRILKSENPDWESSGIEGRGKGKGGAASLAKHREGEEVGKAAPKIGESNIGYRLLASMGWSDGDRIGLSGGLNAPLTAKMKKTKLGLGATLV